MPGEKDLTTVEFWKLASATVKTYSGDPLALRTFLNAVKLVKKFATTPALSDLLKQIILSRLEGDALEYISEDDDVDQILKNLSDAIKPDCSKVIESRMNSLRLDKLDAPEYASKAEELAKALQRALVIEGITLPKAKEMTIDRTIEMCKLSTRNNSVKNILDSKTFGDPKEVIAKLMTAQNAIEKERTILSYRSYRGNGRNFNKRGNFNRNRNFSHNNNNWRNNQNCQNNQNRDSNRGNPNNRRNFNNRRNNYSVRVAENSNSPSTSGGHNQQQPTFTISQ